MTYQAVSAANYPRPYDCVIVDEVQDLSPVQLRILLKLCKQNEKGEQNLFVVGDSSQSLYSRGLSWQQAGLSFRGHAFNIRKNFRSTREIVQAAAALSAHNEIYRAPEDTIDPTVCQRSGLRPTILECDVTDREKRAVVEKILSLCEGQVFRPSDFAVLCPNQDLCQAYQRELTQQHIPCASPDDKNFNILEEQVKILTIHAAKGLEFPVVFIVGLHEHVLPLRDVTGDEDEQALMLERARVLLYVGMTRAADMLYLVTSAQKPSRFLAEVRMHCQTEIFTGGAG
jgi:superfamily I DNA/RNA helicase